MTERERINFYEAMTTWIESHSEMDGSYCSLNGLSGVMTGSMMPESSFATAPGSTMTSRHHAFRGGLMYHCADVFVITSKILASMGPDISEHPWSLGRMREVFLAAMLHDANKTLDFESRPLYVDNVLTKGNISLAKPWKRNPDFCWVESPASADGAMDRFVANVLQDAVLSLPEGRLSLAFIAARDPELYKKLTPDVLEAIEIHDGGYSARRGRYAGKEGQLAIALHCADMISSRRQIIASTTWESMLNQIPEFS
jgi:HD superfamily phosphohydrolase YqeK